MKNGYEVLKEMHQGRMFKDAKRTPASAAEKRAAKKNKGKTNFGKETLDTIKSMLKEHSEKSKYKVTLSQGKEIVQRGKGAYGSSHHPNVSSPTAWGIARLKTFLKAVRSGGKFPSGRFDTDILDKVMGK